jgi:hypothetical protein
MVLFRLVSLQQLLRFRKIKIKKDREAKLWQEFLWWFNMFV